MGLFATSQTRAFGHAKRKSRASKRHYIFLVLGAMFALACVSQRLGFGTVGELMRGEASGSGGTGGRRLLSGAAPCRTFPQWMEDGGWVVYAIGILYLFLGIAIICDDYFTASLELICTKLNLSEDVAGATFMAAGSSAPELFTSTMSLVSEQATNELGVATIVGSAVFNILIIIAATVIFAGKSLQLDWKPVTRDCMFYGLAIVYVLFIMSDGKVWWWEGLIAVVLYFVYVAFMVINERFMTWVDKMVSRKVKDVSAAEDEEGGASNGNGKEGKEGKEGEEEEKKEEEEESKSPFALPDSAGAYPMWLLSLPWYAMFSVTVPDCSKEGKEGWYLVSFFMSVVWISAITYGMVDFAAAVGCMLDIPEVVMGTLVLAAGTSVPDALSSIAVAQNGQGDMAVANAVGSNVFDIFLGLGLPWLCVLPTRGGYEVVSTKQLWPSILILAGVLGVYYFSVALNGFKLINLHGYIFLSAYAVYVVYSIVLVWRLDIYDLKGSEAVAYNTTNTTALP